MIAFLTLERAGVWIRALRSDTVYVESILISIFHYLFIFTEFIIIVFVCVCDIGKQNPVGFRCTI